MSPQAKTSATLLYVADEATGDVYVYSYPAGKLVGTLSGFNTPSGLCSNKAGDVFVLNGGGTTIEVFAHGGSTPLRTLDVPGYPELNCSVDPKTGDLAVGALDGNCGDCVAIFPNAQGQPVTYTPSGQEGLPGCGYDERGNLFCDAYGTDNHNFELYELPAGGTGFTKLAVNASAIHAGSLQWDGEYLAVESSATGVIYQIAVSGSTGTVEGSTTLGDVGDVWQFWIAGANGKKQGKRVVAPSYAGSNGIAGAGYWDYPAGGDPTKTITGSYFAQPDGATLSTLKS
jgi:hypothetical protein